MLKIRICIWLIILGLALSGLTAFPLETELQWIARFQAENNGPVSAWVNNVYWALYNTNRIYPFLSYGTDWLAFAHLMLAILFIGPLKDPVKNIWIIQFGITASVLIFPLAFIAGEIRHIPVFWRLIDCSFGVVALLPLMICYKEVKKLINVKTITL